MGPEIKLRRAREHLNQLRQIEREFFTNHHPRIVFDDEAEPGHRLAKLVLEQPPPEMVHVLAGELIYQIRSALDQMAVAFARLSKGPTKPKRVHFPCGDSFKGFVTSCRSNLKHFDHDLRRGIMATKPYNGGNEILRAVFLMANIDKHMQLIAIGAAGGLSGIDSFKITNVTFRMSGPGNLNDGVIFAEFHPGGSLKPRHANARISVTGQITLGDVDPQYSGKPLIPFLGSMLNEVARVHASLASLLQSSGRFPPPTVYLGSFFR